MKTILRNENTLSNGAEPVVLMGAPYCVHVVIEGVADLLFHRWNCEAVDAKARAAKNSAAKKTDNIESYVYRNDGGELCLPGEYLRQAIIGAAKFKQDPRSPRKSAQDITKAGVVSLTLLATLGTSQWDYEDRRRAVVQRNGVNRVRPAMRSGWRAAFDLMIVLPEYLDRAWVKDTLDMAGRLIGVGDFRPTFGRFTVVTYE